MTFFNLNRIISAGAHSDLPVFLQRKVQPTNAIMLLMFFAVAIPFTGISLIYFPPLAVIPACGGMAFIGTYIINVYGGIYYSRLMASMVPITLAAAYNAYLSGPGETPMPGVYLVELSFSLIPFVVFDLKEKGFLSISVLYSLALIVSFPITRDWLHIEAESTILREGWLYTVTILLGVISGFGCITGLAILNKEAEKHTENLLKDMDDKNAVLQQSAAQLQENLKKVEEGQMAEQKRIWANEGIAKITSLLRTNANKAKTYDQVLSQLVTYVKANQGALYLVHPAEDGSKGIKIKLASYYAYTKKKYLEQTYEAGQGLIGQTYLEKSYVLLTEIPADYVKITSGLGENTPTSLLIMPLKINEEVEGIVEIAAFHKFEPHEINFIEKLGENLAAHIQSNRINEHTSRLLEESVMQGEMMRAQEEEMRQSMEELSATQEETQRKEAEYLKQIDNMQEMLQETLAIKQREEKLRKDMAQLTVKIEDIFEKEKTYIQEIEALKQSLLAKSEAEKIS